MTLFYQALEQFNITDETTAIIILAFLGIVILCLILRIIICIGYQAQIAILKIYAKDLKIKEDITNLKNGIIGKAAKDYVKSREKETSVSSVTIVSKHISRMNFMFWKYESMARFIKSFETSVVFIGLLLAVILEHPMFFGVMAIVSFLIINILASIFDYDMIKKILSDEMIEYLDREIGQFYAVDLVTGISKLRSSMKESAKNQEVVFETAVKKLSEDISGILKLTIEEMALDNTINEWKKAVEGAADYQNNVNKSIEALDKTILTLKNTANAFGEELNMIADKMGEQASASDFVQKNQALLVGTFEKFELSLQDITGKLGSSLASIVDYRLQTSYDTLNDTLAQNIKQIINSNNEFLIRLQKIFESLTENNNHGH